MKKTILFILLAICLVTMATAQGWGRGGMQPRMPWGNPVPDGTQRRLPSSETVTVSGSLVLSNGMPAIQNGGVTYLVSGIMRLTGFIEDLKEGAQVTIEGRAFTTSRENTKFLAPSKLSISGKTYDLSPGGSFGQSFRQFGNEPRQGFQIPQPAPQPRSPRQPAPGQQAPRQPAPMRRQRYL